MEELAPQGLKRLNAIQIEEIDKEIEEINKMWDELEEYLNALSPEEKQIIEQEILHYATTLNNKPLKDYM